MKDFLKTTLAVICGTLLTSALFFFVVAGFFGSLLAFSESTPVLPKSGVLVVDMSKIVLSEQTKKSDPVSSLRGGNISAIGIWDAISAINTAAADPGVKYIYLKTDLNASGISALEEFRKALSDFRINSGKPIISYIESPSTGSYYLASVADKVYMTSYLGATTLVNGVSSQMIFLGDLLNRLGINVQLIKHGKYKSAGEMYTRSSSTPENREQNQRMVDALWEVISSDIAESRGLDIEDVNSAVNDLKLNLPEDFLRCGFVDELMTSEQLEDKLAALAMADNFKDVSMIPFSDYVAVKTAVSTAKKEIAVIYVDGEIVDGSASSDVAGDRFARVIAKARADSSIKAVVLRVNSPGGSVLASEKIKHELDRLKEDKPLIASYGAYAASGGYWISNNCDKIYSDALTLTGSIGVFSIVPEFSKTLKNVAHVNVQSVSSNKHGDLMSCMRPFDADELAYMQKPVEQIYEKFTSVVAEGRDMPVSKVDEIGQGRVWTGFEALHIGLVDEIGTLSDAISYAASLAGNPELSAWKISAYPEPQTLFESIMTMFGGAPESSLIKKVEELKAPMMLARIPYELRFFRP